MRTRKGGGKDRKTLKRIQYYPGPDEIYKLIIDGEGWPYVQNREYYLARDRALTALLYLGALRISEGIRIKKSMFLEKKNYILIRGVKLSKSRVRGKPRRTEFRDVRLPLSGEREPLTMLVLDYVRMLKGDRLFPFSLRKDKNDQIVGCKRAWQIVKALLPQFTAHWLRAFGEDYLYSEWDRDILAVSDYVKVDARTLQEYLRKRHEKYPVV